MRSPMHALQKGHGKESTWDTQLTVLKYLPNIILITHTLPVRAASHRHAQGESNKSTASRRDSQQ